MLRMALRGRIRRAQQPPAQAVEIEYLLVGERLLPARACAEELPHRAVLRIFLRDLFVIRAKRAQQNLVFPLERRLAAYSFVPEDRDPAARPQDAPEFRVRRFWL